MLTDLRHSLRLLRRSPGFTLTAVCTLAVAIGASTAVFSVIDKVFVRPLPIDEPERVVVMWSRERLNAGSIGEFSYAAFSSWQRETRAFERLAAIGSTNWSLILREGEPVTLPVAAVSASFFPLMGTPAAIGRTLLPMDDERGTERVAVMSHGSGCADSAQTRPSSGADFGSMMRLHDRRHHARRVRVSPWCRTVGASRAADRERRGKAGVDLLAEHRNWFPVRARPDQSRHDDRRGSRRSIGYDRARCRHAVPPGHGSRIDAA